MLALLTVCIIFLWYRYMMHQLWHRVYVHTWLNFVAEILEDSLAKLVINPKVDEEVGKVVDVDHKEHVTRKGRLRNACISDWRERCKRQGDQTGSNLHTLDMLFLSQRRCSKNILKQLVYILSGSRHV